MIEATLADRQKKLLKLTTETMPQAMDALGLGEFSLNTGVRLYLKPIFACYMNDEQPELKKQCLEWLRTNNLGTLIKNEVRVPFAQGQDELAVKVKAYINKLKLQFATSETVHNATLKSLMRERIEGGLTFPMDIFRAFHGKKSTIELPKTK